MLTAFSSHWGFFVASLTEQWLGLRARFGLGFEFGHSGYFRVLLAPGIVDMEFLVAGQAPFAIDLIWCNDLVA